MRRAIAAIAVLLTAACIGGLDANYGFQMAAKYTQFPEGTIDSLRIAIYDSDIPSPEDITWSHEGLNFEDRPVLAAITSEHVFDYVVLGVHPGLAQVRVQYRDHDASILLTVTPQTVDSIDVPETITVGAGSTVTLTPTFLVGMTSVHRHNPTLSVANTTVATIEPVASSEPWVATVRGIAAGTTTATITSENGTRTITITVE